MSTAGTAITDVATLFWCPGRIPTVTAPTETISYKRNHNYLLEFIFLFFLGGGGWLLSVTPSCDSNIES
jgi:hypothetical protein